LARGPALIETATAEGSGELPSEFAGLWCDVPGAAVSAFYREQESAGANMDRCRGYGLNQPCMVRLVELDGAPATARLRVPGRLAAAYRTNLLGQIIAPYTTAPAEPPLPGLDE
jgi:hypothetical protein